MVFISLLWDLDVRHAPLDPEEINQPTPKTECARVGQRKDKNLDKCNTQEFHSHDSIPDGTRVTPRRDLVQYYQLLKTL